MPYLTGIVKRHLLFIVLFFFLLSLILNAYQDYGIAWDEKAYIETGRHYLIKIFDLLGVNHNLKETKPFVNSGIHIKTHGVFFDIIVILTSLFFKNFNFEIFHLIKALYSLLIFLLFYLIVEKLFSTRLALISLIFFILFPRFIGDIFYNSIDIPTTLFFSLAVYYFLLYIDSRQNFLQQFFFGLVMALLINQRAIFWYLMVINFLFITIINLKNKKNFTQSVFQQITIFLSTVFFMHLTHPYLFAHPIVGIYNMVKEASKGFPFGAAVLFEGKWYQAGYNPLPWYYLLKSMLITIPPITLVLFFIGNLKILTTLLQPKKSFNQQSKIKKYRSIYLLCIFYLPIILNLIFKPTLYDSWRHFLFLTIPIIIMAMYGLDWLIKNLKPEIQMLNLNFIWSLRFVIWIFIALNLIITAATIIRLHPYEYIYYNFLVGGLKGAYGNYETDYWGLGYKEAVLWFNKNINDPKKDYQIFVEGDPLSSSYYFKSNMQLTTNLAAADYIFTFTRWNFHLRHPGKTIYTVSREGVPLVFIKELRKS